MNDKNKIFSWFFYISIFAIHLLFALQKVYDTDVWLHMGLGKYMVEHRTLPSTDVFTFTGYGNQHEYVEWLFQVVLYLIYQLAGYNGLMIFKLGLWFICMAILWQWMKTEGVESRWAAFFTIFPAFLLALRWRERPELVGYFCLLLYLYVLSLYRHKRRNFFYFLPWVQIIWVNSHPSALLGIGIYGIILLGEGVDYLWDKNKGDLRLIKALVVIIPILVGASLINPYGYKSLLLAYYYNANKTVQSLIAEWRSVWYFSGSRNFYLFFAVPAVLTLLPRFIQPRKNLKVSDTLLFLAGLLLPCWSIRYIAFLALITLPLAGKNIYWFLNSPGGIREWQQKWSPRMARFPWALPGIILVLGLALFALSPKKGLLGWGLQRYTIPQRALTFLSQNQIPGPLYNDYAWGGYVIFAAYPQYMPYVDSRAGLGDVSGKDVGILLESRIIDEAGVDWEKILARRGVNLIMVRSLFHAQGMVLPLVLELLKNPQWVLIWNEDASLIFLRPRAENQLWVEKFTLPKTKVYEEIIQEAQYLIDVHQVTSYSYYSLGWALMNQGNYKEAKVALIKQLQIYPQHQGTRDLMEFLARQGY